MHAAYLPRDENEGGYDLLLSRCVCAVSTSHPTPAQVLPQPEVWCHFNPSVQSSLLIQRQSASHRPRPAAVVMRPSAELVGPIRCDPGLKTASGKFGRRILP